MKAQSEDKTVTWIYFRQKRDRSLFETVLDRVHGTDTSLNDYIFPLLIPKNSFLTCPKKSFLTWPGRHPASSNQHQTADVGLWL